MFLTCYVIFLSACTKRIKERWMKLKLNRIQVYFIHFFSLEYRLHITFICGRSFLSTVSGLCILEVYLLFKILDIPKVGLFTLIYTKVVVGIGLPSRTKYSFGIPSPTIPRPYSLKYLACPRVGVNSGPQGERLTPLSLYSALLLVIK